MILLLTRGTRAEVRMELDWSTAVAAAPPTSHTHGVSSGRQGRSRESSCLLRQFEEERLHSGGGARPGHAHSDQFSSLTRRKSRKSSVGGSDVTRDMDTCTSNVSAWSAASFDWHAGPPRVHTDRQ